MLGQMALDNVTQVTTQIDGDPSLYATGDPSPLAQRAPASYTGFVNMTAFPLPWKPNVKGQLVDRWQQPLNIAYDTTKYGKDGVCVWSNGPDLRAGTADDILQRRALVISNLSDRTRAGFTAVELMMVMGIMLIMLSITVPAVLPALRHGEVSSAVNDIQACWRIARGMAMSSSIPVGATPFHYGIVINQPGSGQITVSLVYDNQNASSPRLLMQGEDPSNPTTTYSAGGTPVAQYTFNRNVVLGTSSSQSVANSATRTKTSIFSIYAQYGTGLPLAPSDVALGRGMVASATSMGVTGMLNTAMGAAHTRDCAAICHADHQCSSDLRFRHQPSSADSTIAFAIFHAWRNCRRRRRTSMKSTQRYRIHPLRGHD